MKNFPMVVMRTLAFACASFMVTVHAAQTATATAQLPGESVYQLDAPLTDQDGRARQFADGRGKPRLVSMFYTSCKFMCPLIIDTIHKTEHALAQSGHGGLDVLMVSFDAAHDTPAALKAMARTRHVDLSHWTLAHADAPQVRRIAAVLGIQYRQLASGDFSHSSVLILLDDRGRIVARTEKMGEADPAFVTAAAHLLDSPSPVRSVAAGNAR
jgi:protein SCO1/2